MDRVDQWRRPAPEHADVLVPFATAVQVVFDLLSGLSDGDLDRLERACVTTSQINCWWVAYQTADLIFDRIADERRQRSREAADWRDLRERLTAVRDGLSVRASTRSGRNEEGRDA